LPRPYLGKTYHKKKKGWWSGSSVKSICLVSLSLNTRNAIIMSYKDLFKRYLNLLDPYLMITSELWDHNGDCP
jgi:hypothetical protein